MIELITVVFAPELPLLQIQAQSIIEYVDNVDRITVVVNDHHSLCELVDVTWWGKHQHKVSVISRDLWNYVSRINGWEEQQLCKLLAAGNSNSKWSMVLDAKTWFIQPLDYKKLFDSQDRVTTGTCGIFKEFVDSHRFIEQYYNIKTDRVLGPSGVPFLFHTDTVKDLISSVDNFPEFFQTHVRYPHLVTEFHLYSGFVLQKFNTFETLYNPSQYYGCHNTSEWQTDTFDQDLRMLQASTKILTASIHRRAYKLLSENQIGAWVNFLYGKNLICNKNKIISLLNTL